jgi:hypothetical protein
MHKRWTTHLKGDRLRAALAMHFDAFLKNMHPAAAQNPKAM